jgi:hypothetical protein
VRRLTAIPCSASSFCRTPSALPRCRRNRSASQSESPSRAFDRSGLRQRAPH